MLRQRVWWLSGILCVLVAIAVWTRLPRQTVNAPRVITQPQIATELFCVCPNNHLLQDITAQCPQCGKYLSSAKQRELRERNERAQTQIELNAMVNRFQAVEDKLKRVEIYSKEQ